MSFWFVILLAVSGGVYALTMAWIWRGIGRRQTTTCEDIPSVSVIVAARDEADSIGDCVRALQEQDYGGDFEIVIVDDGSRDDTAEVAASAVVQTAGASAPARVQILDAPTDRAYRCPKKSALAHGIAATGGDLLLFTDADCRPPVSWMRATVGAFSPPVGLVAGFAFDADRSSWWRRLLALENLGVAAVGAGSIGMGNPLSCTGRNLAYRRRVYDEAGGFTAIGHLIGGDDVYFARLVAARTDWGIVYNMAAEAAVPSNGAKQGTDLIHQKLRHAGKAGHYGGRALALAGTVYLFHLLIGVGLVAGVAGWRPGWWALVAIGVKTALDAAVLGAFGRRFPGLIALIYLPLLELLYVPYVLFFTVAGRLGWFRWKR